MGDSLAMRLWHLDPDTPRTPYRPGPGEEVELVVGTSPVSPGQAVWADVRVDGGAARRAPGTWRHNVGEASYWTIPLGRFARGAHVTYQVCGRDAIGEVYGSPAAFRLGPTLHLALLWHQHQPCYLDPGHRGAPPRLVMPWVRLHALRDYVAMALLPREHPGLHLTINLTPVLLTQIDAYVEEGATDRALELTGRAPSALTASERDELLGGFFAADWHSQIFPHPRYRELFEQRGRGAAFSDQDLTDLQMWFNLAWFGHELRIGEVTLPTGESASVRRFVEQERGFVRADIDDMLGEQVKLLRAVVPAHRDLAARGQLEVSTTPFFHPILPLLVDSDRALLDRDGARRPPRFVHPEDADAQVARAIDDHRRRFGSAPRGMWPAEGAVSPAAVELLGRHGVEWIATDGGVLARSGRWGYRVDDPDVLCRPYRTGDPGVSIFFRDTGLADEVGFRLQRVGDGEAAAGALIAQIEARFVDRLSGDHDRVLTIALDGENAWGGYRDDGRPFLRALYRGLAAHRAIQTVTFSEYLHGRAPDVAPHPPAELDRVHELATASWADEPGSAPGVDLGTWIGDPEENRAWELLRDTCDALARSPAVGSARSAALDAIYAAEGSDWFWWFGDDQESGIDDAFDDLFRGWLARAYRELALAPPPALGQHIVPHKVTWSFTRPVPAIAGRDVLVVQTHCPGALAWQLDDGAWHERELSAAGGVMAGARQHVLALGPFPGGRRVRFRFRCGHPACAGGAPCDHFCCRAGDQLVEVME